MSDEITSTYDYLDLGFDVYLNRGTIIDGADISLSESSDVSSGTSLGDGIETDSISSGSTTGETVVDDPTTNLVEDQVSVEDISSGEINQNWEIGRYGSIFGGADDYNSGEGWWLGYRLSNDDYGFFIGSSTGNKLTYNTTDDILAVTGTITASAGAIGGWTINATSLTDTAGLVGMSSAVTAGDDIRFWAGNVTPASAPFYVTEAGALVASSATITGSITATSGTIGGWTVTSGYIYSLASGTPTSTPNDGLVMASTNPAFVVYEDTAKRIEMGYLSSGVYGLKGYATDGTTTIFELSDTQQLLAGWTFTSTQLSSTSSNIVLDSSASTVRVGSGTPYILIDGANGNIGTSNFSSGTIGWRTEEDGTAEFNNITARGEFHTQVLSYGEVHATAGTSIVSHSAAKLKNDVTTVTSPTTFNVDVDDPDTGHVQVFAVNDILRIKDGSGADNWMTVGSVTDMTTYYRYVCTKNSGTNTTFRAGAGVYGYGQSGDGYLLQTADMTNAPYLSIATHAGSPWTTITEKVRLGNLTGITDAVFGALSGYGLWTDNVYLSGSIYSVNARLGGWTVDSTSIKDTAGAVGLSSAVTAGDDIRIWAGNVTPASAPFIVTEAGVLTASSGTVGGWTLAATTLTGGNITLTNTGVITAGTSDDVAIISSADATWRLWIGDSTNTDAPFRVDKDGNLVASAATITGSITATSGTIGGWTISATSITDTAGAVGLSSTVTAGDDIRIWAGSATPASAPFIVTEAGVLTASSGTVGGWTMAATTLTGTNITLTNTGIITVGTSDDVAILSAADATWRLWIGDATNTDAPFRVDKDGNLVATAATITGSVTATSGTIGGWSITATTIQDTAGAVGMSSAVTGGDDIRFWAGNVTPGSAPFYVTEAGALTASSATITGSVTATSGAIGGWTVTSGYIYSLASGTPISSPNDGVVMSSTNPSLIIYEDTAKRVEYGYLASGIFGIKGYATNGTTRIFELSDSAQAIAGWNFDDIYLYYLSSGTPTSSPNDGLVIAGSTTPEIIVYEDTAKRVEMGYLSSGVYGLKGYATNGTDVIFEMSDTQQKIGGWYFTDSVLRSATTDATSNIFIDSANGLIRFGITSGDYITADGANLRIRSSNYVSGTSGFTLEPDLLEVGNISARGLIRTSVMEYNNITVHSGSDLIAFGGDVLAVDMTALDASTLTIKGTDTFAVGDILYLKNGATVEWVEVTNIASAPTYTVTRDKAGSYSPDNNPIWTIGTAVTNYGQSGNGGLYLTSSDTNGPYLSVYTHAGSPWTTTTSRVRIGNLNGYLDYATEIYGFAVGSSSGTNANITIEPTNGIRIRNGTTNVMTLDNSGNASFSGSVTSTAGYIGGWTINATSITDTAGAVGMSSAVTAGDDIRFWAGDSTPANAEFRVTESGAVTMTSATVGNWTVNSTSIYTGTEDHSGYTTNAGDITIYSDGSDASIHAKNFYIDTSGNLTCTSATVSGAITATSGSITGGFTIGTSGSFSSGQSAYDTGTGFWLEYNAGTPRFSLGNSSGNKLLWDGSALSISGSITSTTGTIGGWTLSATSITDTAGAVGLSSAITAGDDIRFWAGHVTPGSAPFRVTEAGAVTMTSATVGNWTVNSTSIYTGTEDHSGYTANAGDITIYSDGSDASIHAKNFYIDSSGNLTCTSATISGGITTTAGSSLDGQYLTASSVTSAAANLALRGWVQTCAFSVTDADTVAWGSGTLTASDGTAYSISAGNTGNMAAKTYIYLDIAVSTTAYQVSTTATDATGNGKLLVAIAQNAVGEATYFLLNNNSYNIDAANIVAGTITTNEIAASTITGSNIATLSISGKSCTFDTGTVGGWTMGASSLSTTSEGNTVTLSTGATAFLAGPTGTPTVTITAAGVLNATGATISGALTATSGAIGGWTINSTSIYTGTEDHSGYTANAGDLTIYSDGSDASIHAKNFYIDSGGNLYCTSATVSGAVTTTAGSSLDGQYLSAGSVTSAAANLALRGWTQTCAFSVTDADTVAWGAGTFTASDGTAYSILAGNTGDMAAKTYIYLDIAVSTTAYQVTTTATTAVGNGKVMIAIAQNGTGEASFMLLNDNSYNINASNIVTGSITTNEIAATTITGSNIASLAVSGKSCTFDTGTVGGWTMAATTLSSNNITLTTGAVNTANISVGTGSNLAGLNSGNAATDVAFWAGDTFANRASAPARIYLDGSGVFTKVQQLTSDPYFIGYSGDGLLTSVESGGAVERNIAQTYIYTGTSANYGAILHTSDLLFDTMDWDNSTWFNCQIEITETTSQNIFFGLGLDSVVSSSSDIPNNATSTVRHIGFFVDDGTLYASNADGTTQTKTDISSGVTITNWNSYSFVYTAATSIEFKVNGVTKATHTTNIPSGGTDWDLTFGVETTTTAARAFYLANNYYVSQRDA